MAEGAERSIAIRRPAGAVAGLPLPAAVLPAARDWFVRGLAQEVEQRRLFPWLAVAFGAGILVYFGATDGEPALWAPLLAAALCAAVVPFLGVRPVAAAVLLGLSAAFLGFSAGAVRVAYVASPILARTTVGPLAGFIEALDEREEGARLIVRVTDFAGLAPDLLPARVRVSYKKAQSLRPGDFIAGVARLLPPPEAARPGGYDFARDAYFRGIGAVGSFSGKIEVKPPPGPVPFSLRIAALVDDARNGLTRRITDANGGQAGAVAAALVTGKRGLIAPQTNDILRAAGIYHVVSISGLHMVLAAGVVFWLVRATLALVPVLALSWPIKKIAAIAAMAGVTAYCVFSGWDIAAERSLIMTLIMLGAILVDRPAVSMRNLALAALIALAREPEGLLGPSFQMSFGAVAGLIACARFIDGRIFSSDGAGRLGRMMHFAASAAIGTLLTTLVAQIATAPFATYHFQNIQPFGLVGNALTLPLVSLAVMPAAVLGIIAYPFALDRPVWWLMGLAVKGMLAISAWIAGFSQAVVVVPAYGSGALLLLAAGLLIATLPVSHLRWFSMIPAVLGIYFAAIPLRQDIYVDRQGAGAAARGSDGRLVALGRPSSFVLEQWLRADGDSRRPTEALAANCDRLGCIVQDEESRIVAFVRDKRAFPEDCSRADVVITARSAPTTCGANLIIDRSFLADHGAVSIRMTIDGPKVTATRDMDTPSRPWRKRTRPMDSNPMAELSATPAAPSSTALTNLSAPATEVVSDDPEPNGSDTPLERLQ